jgi:hypothetical protein
MTATIRRVAGLLGRAGLMTVVLAIVAGILGMHVMTAAHSAHSSHQVVQESRDSHGAGDIRGTVDMHAADVHGPAHGGHATQPSLAPETCFGSCPGMQDAGPACVLLAKTASLTVFPPEGTASVEPDHAVGASPVARYSYIPASPTPCELSISRT